MKEDNRLIDAIIELGVGMKELRKEQQQTNHLLAELNHRVDKLEKQQIKTNLALGELRLSYMRLDERVGKLDDSFNSLRADFNKYATRNDVKVNGHEKRILHLENSTNGGKPYVIKEPAVKYKKRKNKN